MVVAICGVEGTEVGMGAIGVVERREVVITLVRAVGVSSTKRESEEGIGLICVVENVTCDVRKSVESEIGEGEVDVGVI